MGWDEDIFSLQELLTYGLKGTAAYAAHAAALGQVSDKEFLTHESWHETRTTAWMPWIGMLASLKLQVHGCIYGLHSFKCTCCGSWADEALFNLCNHD